MMTGLFKPQTCPERKLKMVTAITLTTNGLRLFEVGFYGEGQAVWAILWLGAGGEGVCQPLLVWLQL